MNPLAAAAAALLLAGPARPAGAADGTPGRTDPRPTAEVVAALDAADPAVRLAAIRAIGEDHRMRTVPSEVLHHLREALAAPDPAFRRASARALAGLASRVHISSRTGTGTAFGRPVSVDFEADPPMRGALAAALGDPDAEVRSYAPVALGLAYPADAAAESALVARWPVEKDLQVRRHLVTALSRGGYGSAQARAVFAQALKSEDPIIRTRARRALQRLDPAGSEKPGVKR